MKILALDTATELCSAALYVDGECRVREDARPRGSGELILGMVAELLTEAALTLSQLDAIAFGRGPGGFTGVRLAVAVAQGLGFASGLPLLPVSDLRALAQQALLQPGAPPRVLVCQDARMAQVYWACYQADGPEPGSPLERLIAAGIIEPAEEPGGVGDIDPYPSPASGRARPEGRR